MKISAKATLHHKIGKNVKEEEEEEEEEESEQSVPY